MTVDLFLLTGGTGFFGRTLVHYWLALAEAGRLVRSW